MKRFVYGLLAARYAVVLAMTFVAADDRVSHAWLLPVAIVGTLVLLDTFRVLRVIGNG